MNPTRKSNRVTFLTVGTFLILVMILPCNLNMANQSSYESGKIKITSLVPTIDTYPKIAFVRPDFTNTAYSDNAFYSFYDNPSLDPTKFLTKQVVSGWGILDHASDFISALKQDGYPNDDISIISDVDVHNNKLYDLQGNKLFNTLVFFHNEYVTEQEYFNVINFIENKGNVIVENGNAFFAEISYNNSTNQISLVNGHNFEFDGKKVTPSYHWRFNTPLNDNLNFYYLGSESCAFNAGSTKGAEFNITNSNPHPIAETMVSLGYKTMAGNYNSHEENCVITKNVRIIADWRTSFAQNDRGIKVYEYLPFGPFGGSVIHFGYYGSDILFQDKPSRITFVTTVEYQAGMIKTPDIKYPVNNGVYSGNKIAIDFTSGWNTEVFLNGTYHANIQPKNFLYNLRDGNYNLSIVFKNNGNSSIRAVEFTIDNKAPDIQFSLLDEILNSANPTYRPIRISIQDSNPEFFSIFTTTGNQINNPTAYSILDNVQVIRANNFNLIADKTYFQPFGNGTTNIYVNAFDSAGNSNATIFTFNTNYNGTIIPIVEKMSIERINESYLEASISPSNLHYLSKLEISRDYGKNWETYVLDNYNKTNNRYYTYIPKKLEDFFLYKEYLNGSSFSLYLPFIKTYYWNYTANYVQLATKVGNIAYIKVINMNLLSKIQTSTERQNNTDFQNSTKIQNKIVSVTVTIEEISLFSVLVIPFIYKRKKLI